MDGVVHIVQVLEKRVFCQAGDRELGKERDITQPGTNGKHHLSQENLEDYLLRQLLKIRAWHRFKNRLMLWRYGYIRLKGDKAPMLFHLHDVNRLAVGQRGD